MATAEKTTITVEATINAPVEKVWAFWTNPIHITRWNNASDEWHTPRAENDVRVGGRFLSRMEAKDGSMGFDFEGIYQEVEENQRIAYTLPDGRKVQVIFSSQQDATKVTESFDAENTLPVDMQQTGWQAILDNFKKYVETHEFETLHFETTIKTPAEEVYKRMLDEKTYREWTAVFNPTSHYVGSWEKGSKILFLGADEKGELGGMVSRVKENVPNRFVSIEHQGLVQNGQEITSGEEVEPWAGCLENYTFREEEGKTLLLVDTDSNQEFKSFFEETWPIALQKLKTLCEA